MGYWKTSAAWSGAKLFLLSSLLVYLAPISLAQAGSCIPLTTLKSANQSSEHSDECEFASAISKLKRLDEQVLVYHSLGEFEQRRALARVSFEEFSRELREVMAAVGPILDDLPDSKLKWAIVNALYSYRDGVFWWSKIHRDLVVNVAVLPFSELTRAPSDQSYDPTIPYLVSIHWRQANKYLKRAQALNRQ